MQFHLILNGGEGSPPPPEFMVIVTVSLEVRYYVTACILALLSAMEWRLIAWRFPFVIEPCMMPTRFIICIIYIDRTLRGCFVYYVCVGVGRVWGVKDILRSLLKASNNVFHYSIPGQHKCCISISLVQIQEKLWYYIVTQNVKIHPPPPPLVLPAILNENRIFKFPGNCIQRI